MSSSAAFETPQINKLTLSLSAPRNLLKSTGNLVVSMQPWQHSKSVQQSKGEKPRYVTMAIRGFCTAPSLNARVLQQLVVICPSLERFIRQPAGRHLPDLRFVSVRIARWPS